MQTGINDITTFHFGSNSEKVLKRSDVNSGDLISRLQQFKAKILEIRPTALVAFVTIPPASFAKFQNSKHLKIAIFTGDVLRQYQRELDDIVDLVNNFIKSYNNEPQHHIIVRTLSWHTSVRKPSKRRSLSRRLNRVIRNDFSVLYDGLHSISTIKRRWHIELLRAFEIDRRVVLGL